MMAYLEPGSGTLIWQLVILSFFLGTIFFISKFKGWVLSRTQKAKEPPATTQNPASEKETSPRVMQTDSPASENEPRVAERSSRLPR